MLASKMFSALGRQALTRLQVIKSTLLPPYGPEVALAISSGVFLAMVLPVGPMTQELFQAITSTARDSIYANVFGEVLPSENYFSYYWNHLFPYSLIGISAAAISMKSRGAKNFLVNLWVWLATLLTASDVLFILFHDIEMDLLFSTFANVAGSSFAVAIVSTFVLVDVTGDDRQSPIFLLKSAALGGVLGLITIFVARYSYDLFLKPQTHFVRASVEKPHAFKASMSKDGVAQSDTARTFYGIFPQGPAIKSVSGMLDGPLKINWTSAAPEGTRRVRVYMVSDCGLGWRGFKRLGVPLIDFDQARSVSVAAQTITSAQIRFSEKTYVRPELEGHVTSWPGKTAKAEGFSWAVRTTGKSSFSFDPRNDFDLQVTNPVIDLSEDGKVKFEKRKLVVSVDDRVIDLTAVPVHPYDGKKKVACENAKGSQIKAHVDVSVLIRVSGYEKSLYFGDEGQSFDLRGGRGQFWIFASDKDELDDTYLGRTEDLTIYEGVKSVIAGERKISVPSDHPTLYASGDINVTSIGNDRYRIEGEVKNGYLGDVRINRTRWEELPSEWKIGLLSALLAGIGATIRFLWPKIFTRLDAI